MQKFIPYEKLSKKQKRERNTARRATWEGRNPVTRKTENAKAYNRKKTRRQDDASLFTGSFQSSARRFLRAFQSGKSSVRIA